MFETRVVLNSFDHRALDEYCIDLVVKLLRSGYGVRGPVMMPTRLRRWVFHAGPHVDSKSKVHYELRSSKRLVIVSHTDKVSASLPELFRGMKLDSRISISI